MRVFGLGSTGAVWAALAALSLSLPACSKKGAGVETNPTVDQTTPDEDSKNPPGGDTGSGPNASEEDRGLKDVFFDYDDYTLTAEARSTLTNNAGYLREMSGLKVTIEGHCDERGTVEYNLALGQRRADAARSYLVNLGVDGGRLSTISYGEEKPFELGHSEAAWSKNRRAHFRLKQ
jgi:peptidoglycan-associated lipoprotein